MEVTHKCYGCSRAVRYIAGLHNLFAKEGPHYCVACWGIEIIYLENPKEPQPHPCYYCGVNQTLGESCVACRNPDLMAIEWGESILRTLSLGYITGRAKAFDQTSRDLYCGFSWTEGTIKQDRCYLCGIQSSQQLHPYSGAHVHIRCVVSYLAEQEYPDQYPGERYRVPESKTCYHCSRPSVKEINGMKVCRAHDPFIVCIFSSLRGLSLKDPTTEPGWTARYCGE